MLRKYVSLFRRPRATLVGTLKQSERIFIQLFMSRSLLRTSQSKLLSSEVYYSKAEHQKDVATLALTKVAPLKVIRL